MNLWQLFQKLRPFVRPYRTLVIATLFLTLIGSLTAQVNALTLQYAVDSINQLIKAGQGLAQGWHILVTISAVLLIKEVVNAVVQFGQKFYGERLRIMVSQDLAQNIIEKFLTYRLTFFTEDNNQAGKLQTRIDRGIGSLTRLVQIFFIDILPLFTSAIVALGLMFYANVCGNIQQDYLASQIDSQLKSELLTALQPAFAKISEMGICAADSISASASTAVRPRRSAKPRATLPFPVPR